MKNILIVLNLVFVFFFVSNIQAQTKTSDNQNTMKRFVVERTFPDGLEIPVNEIGKSVCLNVVLTNSEEQVTWVHSYVSDDKKKTFCIYDAPSPEAIRVVAEKNKLPVDKITEVSVLDPYFYK